ncbi:DUF3558 family protein [Umezawaea sp.]|uniref:DUF3558 family protein n=1 Tax=Umezawaea sp. TaxID=1955258 RepID=UPI002ED43F12
MSLVSRSVVSIVALVLVLAGCSQQEGGNPAPATTTGMSSTSAAEPTTPTSSSSGAGNALATFDGCKVLTAVAGQFSLTDIEEIAKEQCGAKYGAVPGVSVSLRARPDLGYEEAQGGPNAELTNTTVGSRKAKLVKKAFSSSSCLVAVEVTSTSRVDFMSSANASLDDACAAATAVATAVEPSLPK